MLKFLFGYKSKVRIEHEQIGMDGSELQQKNEDESIDFDKIYQRHA
jgi:hypothetical protein